MMPHKSMFVVMPYFRLLKIIMAKRKDTDALQLGGIHVLISKSPASPDLEQCIICQKKGKKFESLHSGGNGRKRVCDVAVLKDDIVNKRLKILGPNSTFKYHNTYTCYKRYTDIRNLPPILEEPEVSFETNELLEAPTSLPTGSTGSPRSRSSTNVHPDYIKYAICGFDREWKRARENFRICSHESAKKCLDAMTSRKDDVFVRCADLNTPESIFAADIYCHKTCFTQYVHLPKQSETKPGPSQTKPRHDLFMEAVPYLDPLIKNGYGLTVTEIKDFMSSLTKNEDAELYNKDVKKGLLVHYGDKIQFCPSHRLNEPEMCFS